MAEALQQISREMPPEDCRRDNLPLLQSCKDKSLQTMLNNAKVSLSREVLVSVQLRFHKTRLLVWQRNN